MCPEGFALRDDGKTCAIVCYVCDNVYSNDECDDTIQCPFGADACFTTMRTRDNVTTITKGCQQTLACINNMLQVITCLHENNTHYLRFKYYQH